MNKITAQELKSVSFQDMGFPFQVGDEVEYVARVLPGQASMPNGRVVKYGPVVHGHQTVILEFPEFPQWGQRQEVIRNWALVK